MRYIKRFEKPEILQKKEKEWTEAFLASDKTRPDNSKYAHKDIVKILKSMSFHKCFYCETSIKGTYKEIDHYIEVAERKDLAYNWENLYLACSNCNDKIPNKSISVTDTLNPCLHTDTEIEACLSFENETIRAINNTQLGLKTIQKFHLDTESLDALRSKQLHYFKDILIEIKENQIKENRKKLTDKEIESLKTFAQEDSSFSLMFKILLRKYFII